MLERPKSVEQRQFGRRTTCVHGWIKVPHRPKIACMVRNISASGALLEVSDPQSLPYRFQLLVETSNLEADCEVKHRGQHSVGVYFAPRDLATDDLPVATTAKPVLLRAN